jgi:hypothetical protein
MMRRITYRSGLSGIILVLGILVTFAITVPIQALAPNLGEQAGLVIVLVLVVICCAGAAALWGYLISRIANSGFARQIAIAGAISYACAVILAIMLLGRLEPIVVEEGRLNLPIHIAYAVLFVPAALLVCALVGGAVGIAVNDLRLAWRLAWRSGVAGALAFLLLDIAQDLLGRRVGGPNAAATATMITVTLVCMLGAAIAASAAIGRTLAARSNQASEHQSVLESAVQ